MADYKKPSSQELRTALTAMQFSVTQEEGTEPPFDNEYWDNNQTGIYVDIVSGEALFSSLDKFDSHCGWPSFTRALQNTDLTEKTDNKLFAARTEVRSRLADSHLGHLFTDGPAPEGLRYCINSASVRFIAVENMAEQGYQELLQIFGE